MSLNNHSGATVDLSWVKRVAVLGLDHPGYCWHESTIQGTEGRWGQLTKITMGTADWSRRAGLRGEE